MSDDFKKLSNKEITESTCICCRTDETSKAKKSRRKRARHRLKVQDKKTLDKNNQ